ncbi:MAG: GreA/GreB family elongation factor, partial [Holophagae bacterium]|nr:GreA/GreB family elongation factor [Holophagae bacterium]
MPKELINRIDRELKEMEYELTQELPKEIQRAAAMGDLSENAEYEAALAKQQMLQSKLLKLKKRRVELSQIDFSRLPKDRVGYGSKVVLFDLDEDKEISYTLVMGEEANSPDCLSISSPIGKSLLGKREGDEV